MYRSHFLFLDITSIDSINKSKKLIILEYPVYRKNNFERQDTFENHRDSTVSKININFLIIIKNKIFAVMVMK